jgi:hypothetical protein
LSRPAATSRGSRVSWTVASKGASCFYVLRGFVRLQGGRDDGGGGGSTVTVNAANARLASEIATLRLVIG